MTPCHNRDEWTSEDPTDRLLAALECGGCPVAQQCLDGAMERREKYAIWGGIDFGMNDGRAGFHCQATWDCFGKIVGFGPRGEHTVPTCAQHSYAGLRGVTP